jgi:hypothetical protein
MKLQDALQLIEDHSQSAIDQITPPLSRRDVEVSSPAEALRLAFLWRTSREGYSFWRDVHNKLESGIPIPEPVPVLTPEPEPEPVLTPEPEPVRTTVDPHSIPVGCPRLPALPAGYSHWEYRGMFWVATNVVYTCWFRGESSLRPFSGTSGEAGGYRCHYFEAVKIVVEPVAVEPVAVEPVPPTSLSAPVPRDLLPLPPLPNGYSHWVYRGTGWTTNGREVCFHCRHFDENTWEGIAPLRCDAGGFENLHYIEAVREPLQCEVGRCYVQRDGVVRNPLVPTPSDLRGVEYHPFWDGHYYRTPEGYIFLSDPRGSSGYIAEVEPQ